jgi:glycosyltransferase involved in cell wall biosynthesis
MPSSRATVLKRQLFDIQQRQGRAVLGRARLLAARLADVAGRPATALRQALAAHRLLYTPAAFEAVLRYLPALATHGDALVSNDVERKEAILRSIVLRWPTVQDGAIAQKGILVITFTKVSSYYYRNVDVEKLARYFHIVLEPSWSGYMDADILFWTTKTREPVFVQSSEIRDRVALECLCSNLVPISIGASDWVDHRNFTPKECGKVYDSIYVANTSPVKRIHVYLKAIRRIAREYDPEYRGVLVCAAWGGKAQEIQGLIDHYGVGANCELKLSLSQAELSELLGACKVNVLLSLKEGSNRSLFESMFCNLPVIALADNIGVNKTYINEYTGALVYEERLSEVLVHMAAHWRNYQPRRWALENIAPEATTRKLLGIIEARTGETPRADSPTFIKINNPEVSYLEYPQLPTADVAGPLLDAFSLEGFCDINHEIARCHSEFMLRITTGAAADSKPGSKI